MQGWRTLAPGLKAKLSFTLPLPFRCLHLREERPSQLLSTFEKNSKNSTAPPRSLAHTQYKRTPSPLPCASNNIHSGHSNILLEFLECCGQAPPLCKDLGSRRTFHDCLATLCWGTKGTSAQSRAEEHRRAGESCVDSKAVGLHGLVLADSASLNGRPLRRRSTTLSFKTCAGIATSAACALVLMFRAVSETRHAVWLFCCSRRAQPPHVRSSCCVRPAPCYKGRG